MNAPAVVCNGGALHDFKTERYPKPWSCRRPSVRRVRMWTGFPQRQWRPITWDNVIHAVRPNEYTRQHEHVTHAGVQPVPTLLEVPMPLIKIMFEDDHEHLLALRDYVSRRSLGQRTTRCFSPTGLCWRSPGRVPARGYGSSSGKASGDLHGSYLLRRGRKQRSLHADDGGRGVCPGQLRKNRAEAAALPLWRTATTIPFAEIVSILDKRY